MWIEDLPNGKYKYVERYDDPLTGKKRKVSMTHTKKNKRVEKELFMKLQEKIEKKIGSPLSAQSISLNDVIDKWLAIHQKQVRQSTYRQNFIRLNALPDTIKQTQMNQLTAAMINQYLLNEFDKGYVYTTVNDKKKDIIRALTFAYDYGYLANKDVIDRITIPQINKSDKNEFKYLEPDELKSLVNQLNAMNYQEGARLAELQSLTGVRFGELISIDYRKHVNFTDKLLYIDSSYDFTHRVFTLPKNGKKRIIHINNQAIAIIQEQIQYDQLKMMQSNLDRNNTLLFRTSFENPFPIGSMNRFLKKVTIPNKPKITTHYFRHTFISLMVAEGVDMKLIAEHVGHASTKMIEQVYAHFTDKMNERLKQSIDNIKII